MVLPDADDETQCVSIQYCAFFSHCLVLSKTIFVSPKGLEFDSGLVIRRWAAAREVNGRHGLRMGNCSGRLRHALTRDDIL